VKESRKTLSSTILDDECTRPVRWNGDSMNWRKIIGSPYCDLTSAQKHILTILSRYGDKLGNSIFPSQREIAFRAGVSPKCVTHAMQRAEREGWIIRHEAGTRQGYKRHRYELTVPQGVLDATALLGDKWWEPPFEFGLKRLEGNFVLVNRLQT